MLYINVRRPKCLVDADEEFKSLTYSDISKYAKDLRACNAFLRIINNPTPEMQTIHIAVETVYGICMLSDIATSLKILILANIAIEQKRRICFVAGDVGDNYLNILYKMCRTTNFVSLYQKDGVLPQFRTCLSLECR